MSTDQRYREKAEEAREKAAAAGDREDIRNMWLEIAKQFEWLADRRASDPAWRVERVTPEKEPR
jgi:hypothetical protein